MEITLTPIETRALAVLVEKEFTTPEYYPMSLNSLTNACNQKSNREPVMSLDESEVEHALATLKSKRLVWKLDTAGGRVPKFEHNFTVKYSLEQSEAAVLCGLMLRGAQTPGEIKSRTARMHEFAGLGEVESVLEKLMQREEGPFVTKLPRQPGRKENRYMHLFAGEPEEETSEEVAKNESVTGDESDSPGFDSKRINVRELAEEVEALRQEVAEIRSAFEKFRTQFE